ncbi:MAG: serine/threonine-protein kinase [Myxococcales bacterium]|jgi:serine/threonine-protein kinase
MADNVKLRPVRVNEAIPIAGDHRVPRDDIEREGIPTPAGLCVHPELGRGGMGRIHPAVDRNLLRPVALKRLDQGLSQQAFYRDGFIAEAQITGQLEHPNVVPVHDLAVSERGVPYFTMKLVQGRSLHEWMHDRAFPVGSTARLEEGLSILVKVCDALAYAHHRGVVHRDIKPENVMVATFGQVYLMDWGLARLTKTRPASGSNAQMEAPGPVGTPGYMAPEQARGIPDEMTEACDIFGMGALLYELVSGKTPFGSSSSMDELLDRTRAGQVVALRQAAPGIGIPRRLRELVERATAAAPEERYPSVVELQQDLQAFLRGGLHLPRRLFLPGETIIREGEPGDCAYVIVEGSCRAYRTAGGQREVLATMEAGDVFGEMALVLGEPRAASVDAIDHVAVLVLDKQTMEEGVGVDGWTGALLRALATRFRDLEATVRRSGIPRDG